MEYAPGEPYGSPGFLFRKTSLVPRRGIGYNERRHEKCQTRVLHNMTACRHYCVMTGDDRAKPGCTAKIRQERDNRAKPGHLGNTECYRDALRDSGSKQRGEQHDR